MTNDVEGLVGRCKTAALWYETNEYHLGHHKLLREAAAALTALENKCTLLADHAYELETEVTAQAEAIASAGRIMAAWENGVCPEGVALDKDCPRCPVKCNVYSEWLTSHPSPNK